MDYGRPIINTRRLHPGQRFNQARTCWTCGNKGHIQRFCVRKQRHQGPRGELFPGTSPWCEALGLDDDPLLKANIKSTLNNYPGATIYLNDECIYRGVQTYFYRKTLPQGPDIAGRLKRPIAVDRYHRRSRSPSRERIFKRSRSPLGRLGQTDLPDMVRDGRYYQERSLSPVIPLVDVEVVSLPQANRIEDVPPGINPLTTTCKQPLMQAPRATPPGPSPSPRSVIGFRSAINGPRSSLLEGPISDYSIPLVALECLVQTEDPHFVLGISQGAREAEIISGFQQRMWEIELERSTEGHLEKGDKASVDRWEESIKILRAAKAQLLIQ